MATGASRKVDITALGPAAASTVLWQMAGRLHVTVVVKASFAFAIDAAMTRIEPEEILRAEIHHNKNPMRSVRSTGDLAPFQPLADVVLTGHACAPQGTPALALSVRLVVFREVPLIDKTLYVRGDTQGTETVPFERIPLMYERAFGGIGWEENPLGVGAGAATSAKSPNVIDPAEPKRVASFGPISRGWPLRKRLLGTADRKALDRPIAEVPVGFDWAYFQSAPLDQRTEYLQGNEWIILDGMNPTHGHIQSYLPGARGFARIHGVADGGAGHLLPLAADTLRIDADSMTCSVTWRASFPVQGEDALSAIRIVAGVESDGHPLDWPAPPPPSSPPPAPQERPTEVLSVAVLLPPQGAATMVFEDAPDRGQAPPAARGRPPATVEIVEVLEDVTDLASSVSIEEVLDEPPAAPWSGTMAIAPEAEQAATRAPAFPFRRDLTPRSSPETQRLPPIAAPDTAPLNRSTLYIEEPDDRTVPRSLPFLKPLPPPLPAPPRPPPLDAPPPLEAPTRPMAPLAPEPPPEAPTRPMAPIVPAPAPAPQPAAWEEAPLSEPQPTRVRAPTPARPRSGAIEIINDTALALAVVPWGMTPSRDCLTVIAKATCDLVPGGPAKLRAAADPQEGDRFDEASSSCVYPSDFALFKVRADVVLTGHAVAPKGGAVPSLRARLAFGSDGNAFDRSIVVFGDRRWEQGPVAARPSAPEPFLRMPLVHARAFGGPKSDANPAGVGYPDRMRRGPALLPNLEDPARLLRTPSQIGKPACFAPIPRAWKEIEESRGTRREVWPCFPEELDWTRFQAAPRAQQLAFLRGDEAFEIAGMRQEHPLLTGSLPGFRARCVRVRGAVSVEVPLHLDTVVFDLDALRVHLVWRGSAPVADERAPDIDALRLTTERVAEDPTLRPAPRRGA